MPVREQREDASDHQRHRCVGDLGRASGHIGFHPACREQQCGGQRRCETDRQFQAVQQSDQAAVLEALFADAWMATPIEPRRKRADGTQPNARGVASNVNGWSRAMTIMPATASVTITKRASPMRRSGSSQIATAKPAPAMSVGFSIVSMIRTRPASSATISSGNRTTTRREPYSTSRMRRCKPRPW